ncbi:hypothetical protein PoB_002205800 [Plakobranchus ocellatus]|uniref:Secreted protein n=1 Tax=Plakobranchus ocellatus TaxID=259542 RepID=A0AAV3ZL46_9GAST|nr:hypothetical protein PoB_002205800 [Plakobranchus ocellatus]
MVSLTLFHRLILKFCFLSPKFLAILFYWLVEIALLSEVRCRSLVSRLQHCSPEHRGQRVTHSPSVLLPKDSPRGIAAYPEEQTVAISQH